MHHPSRRLDDARHSIGVIACSETLAPVMKCVIPCVILANSQHEQLRVPVHDQLRRETRSMEKAEWSDACPSTSFRTAFTGCVHSSWPLSRDLITLRSRPTIDLVSSEQRGGYADGSPPLPVSPPLQLGLASAFLSLPFFHDFRVDTSRYCDTRRPSGPFSQHYISLPLASRLLHLLKLYPSIHSTEAAPLI